MKRLLVVRCSRSSEAGAALVEMAVALPILVALLVGTADFARVFYTAIAMTNPARAGAQFGAKNLGAGGNSGQMESAATCSVNIPGMLADASRLCECANTMSTFTATSPSANNCTDP